MIDTYWPGMLDRNGGGSQALKKAPMGGVIVC